jgi:hypothetical protein
MAEATRRAGSSWALAAALAAVVLVPAMPLGGRVPGVDSGIYLYNGWRLTLGEVPYRDFWDNKPPLIYYLNALGLLLGGGGEWGVWALQLVFLAAAFFLAQDALERAYGRRAAWLATALAAAGATRFLEGGNYVEPYALPLQLAVVWLAARGAEGPRAGAAVGALAGVLLLLKQNMIAMPAAWLLTRPWRTRPRACAAEAAALAAAAAVVAGAPLALCAARASAAEVWSQAFAYNLVHASAPAGERLAALWSGLERGAGFSMAMAAGWALLALGGRSRPPVERLALAGLPLTLAATAAPGMRYGHYWLPWLAPGVVGVAALASRWPRPPEPQGPALLVGGALLLSCAGIWREETAALLRRRGRPDPVVSFLQAHSTPEQPVLVWSHVGMRYYFAARRRSAARLAYHSPLFRRGYASDGLAAELLADLRARPPAAVVDGSAWQRDIPPIAAAARRTWAFESPRRFGLNEAAEPALRWLETNYVPAARLGDFVGYLPKDG